jgi:hypothetical protein
MGTGRRVQSLKGRGRRILLEKYIDQLTLIRLTLAL